MRGLWIDPKSGKRYYRTRRGGKLALTELSHDLALDHPDFIAAWAAAAKNKGQGAKPTPPPRAGTIGSEWAAILDHASTRALSPTYRAMLARESAAICAKARDIPCRAVAEKHVRADVTTAPVPASRLKAWRQWAKWCIGRGIIDTDPTHAVRRPAQPKTEGYPFATPDHIAAFRARHPIGTAARAVMELIYWTGARISDAVHIGPQNIGPDGVLAFRQQKTGDMAYVPWTCALPDYAAALETDRQMMLAAIAPFTGHLTFIPSKDGRSRSSKALGMQMQKACRAAGIPVSAHGFRKARAIALAQNGASTRQVGAWTGHHSLAEITRYTEGYDRRRAVMGTGEERQLDVVSK
jgi:site-specific recombinase XerD